MMMMMMMMITRNDKCYAGAALKFLFWWNQGQHWSRSFSGSQNGALFREWPLSHRGKGMHRNSLSRLELRSTRSLANSCVFVWLVVWNMTSVLFFHILGILSSQLTNPYFSEVLKAPQEHDLDKNATLWVAPSHSDYSDSAQVGSSSLCSCRGAQLGGFFPLFCGRQASFFKCVLFGVEMFLIFLLFFPMEQSTSFTKTRWCWWLFSVSWISSWYPEFLTKPRAWRGRAEVGVVLYPVIFVVLTYFLVYDVTTKSGSQDFWLDFLGFSRIFYDFLGFSRIF